jgi:hypothetical protein
MGERMASGAGREPGDFGWLGGDWSFTGAEFRQFHRAMFHHDTIRTRVSRYALYSLAECCSDEGDAMFGPQHCGLFFAESHIQQARDQRDLDPFASVWARLRQHKPLDLLSLAQWQGLRYRFDESAEAGERAARILQHDDLMPAHPVSRIEALAAAITQAQVFEMVRDHPAFDRSLDWMQGYAALVDELNRSAGDELYVEQLWMNLLNLVTAILLEQEEAFYQAVDAFKGVIRHDVHPDGYIRRATQGPQGESLMRMLLAAQALILTAEAASHAGEDLWTFNERRVSALTPMPYLLYYYYYPEKWRWDAETEGGAIPDAPEVGHTALEIDSVQALYRRHGGIWEMAQRQTWSQDRQVLLDEIRPVHDVWSGGLVTLTHGTTVPKRKRFGLF